MIVEKGSSIIVGVVECICITSFFYYYFLSIFIFQQLVRIQTPFFISLHTIFIRSFPSASFSGLKSFFKITALKTQGKCYQPFEIIFPRRPKVEERQQIDFEKGFFFSISSFLCRLWTLFAFVVSICT